MPALSQFAKRAALIAGTLAGLAIAVAAVLIWRSLRNPVTASILEAWRRIDEQREREEAAEQRRLAREKDAIARDYDKRIREARHRQLQAAEKLARKPAREWAQEMDLFARRYHDDRR